MFYRYFASKDELFLAMLYRETNDLVARLDAIAADCSAKPAEQLELWIIEMFDLAENPVRAARAVVLLTDDVRAVRGYREFRRESDCVRQRSMLAILRRGRQDGSFPLAEPDDDVVAIDAVCIQAISSQVARDRQTAAGRRPALGSTQVLDFAMRSLGVR